MLSTVPPDKAVSTEAVLEVPWPQLIPGAAGDVLSSHCPLPPPDCVRGADMSSQIGRREEAVGSTGVLSLVLFRL